MVNLGRQNWHNCNWTIFVGTCTNFSVHLLALVHWSEDGPVEMQYSLANMRIFESGTGSNPTTQHLCRLHILLGKSQFCDVLSSNFCWNKMNQLGNDIFTYWQRQEAFVALMQQNEVQKMCIRCVINALSQCFIIFLMLHTSIREILVVLAYKVVFSLTC